MIFVRRCFTCRRPAVVYGPPREVLSRHHHYHHPDCLRLFLSNLEGIARDLPDADLEQIRALRKLMMTLLS